MTTLKTKEVYSYNPDTQEFIGISIATESPHPQEVGQELTIWHIPRYAIEISPLPIPEGKNALFNGNGWDYIDIPQPPAPIEPTPEEMLEQAKADKKQEILFRRQQLSEFSTIEYNSNNFSNSQSARIAIISFIQKLNDTETTTYFTAPPERNIAELKKSDFEAIGDIIQNREIALRMQEKQLYNQIDSSSLEEVLALNINAIMV